MERELGVSLNQAHKPVELTGDSIAKLCIHLLPNPGLPDEGVPVVRLPRPPRVPLPPPRPPLLGSPVGRVPAGSDKEGKEEPSPSPESWRFSLSMGAATMVSASPKTVPVIGNFMVRLL